jgi:hypothetical protein
MGEALELGSTEVGTWRARAEGWRGGGIVSDTSKAKNGGAHARGEGKLQEQWMLVAR